MIRQLAHLCFYTDRLEQMVHFYRDGLGLPVKFTLNDDDGHLMGYYFECGNSTTRVCSYAGFSSSFRHVDDPTSHC
jgi:catechol 2,3-dioxygenase-like lactoylglutathione lyase family enzyme